MCVCVICVINCVVMMLQFFLLVLLQILSTHFRFFEEHFFSFLFIAHTQHTRSFIISLKKIFFSCI